MGIVWTAYHKGVPLLGVPENPIDFSHPCNTNLGRNNGWFNRALSCRSIWTWLVKRTDVLGGNFTFSPVSVPKTRCHMCFLVNYILWQPQLLECFSGVFCCFLQGFWPNTTRTSQKKIPQDPQLHHPTWLVTLLGSPPSPQNSGPLNERRGGATCAVRSRAGSPSAPGKLGFQKSGAFQQNQHPKKTGGVVNLLSQWLTFWTFGDSIFSRENKVQTFFSGSIGWVRKRHVEMFNRVLVVATQIFFFVSPRKLGKWSKLTHIFEMGWFNHQLAGFLTIKLNWIHKIHGIPPPKKIFIMAGQPSPP